MKYLEFRGLLQDDGWICPAFVELDDLGKIVSIEQHPDADKLRVCRVAGGSEVVQVVCGAPNAWYPMLPSLA